MYFFVDYVMDFTSKMGFIVILYNISYVFNYLYNYIENFQLLLFIFPFVMINCLWYTHY